MRETEEQLRARIGAAVDAETILSLRTYYLSDYGELVLRLISETILDRFGRADMLDILYPAAKELVINATKANLKRVIFEDHNIQGEDPEQYERGMQLFREQLSEERIMSFKDRFRETNYSVTATFYYEPDVLNVKVKNNFVLHPYEEARIRERFAVAKSFSNLFEFFTEFGDDSEGASLGLTMVGILLDQSGIDKHGFVVCSNEYEETAARLEIPLSTDYVPRRQMFRAESRRTGLAAQELRENYVPKPFRARLRAEA